MSRINVAQRIILVVGVIGLAFIVAIPPTTTDVVVYPADVISNRRGTTYDVSNPDSTMTLARILATIAATTFLLFVFKSNKKPSP